MDFREISAQLLETLDAIIVIDVVCTPQASKCSAALWLGEEVIGLKALAALALTLVGASCFWVLERHGYSVCILLARPALSRHDLSKRSPRSAISCPVAQQIAW